MLPQLLLLASSVGSATAAAGVTMSCATPPLSALKFCDAAAPVEARVADLLPRLTVPELIGQIGINAPNISRLGMIAWAFGGEADHGVWSTCANASTGPQTCTCMMPGDGEPWGWPKNVTSNRAHVACRGNCQCATQFPATLTMAASFDRELWRAIGSAIGSEARALRKHRPRTFGLEGTIGLSFYSPTIDILRACTHPHVLIRTGPTGAY
jgi:hypothetical protein